MLVSIEFYEFIKNHLKKLQVHYIDLNEDYKYSSTLLRDIVHTTDTGSELYAQNIFEKFNQIKFELKIPEMNIETKYDNIKSLQVDEIFYKTITFTGEGEIICFELEVGPNSSALQFHKSNNIIKIWDQWCYYKRKTMKFIEAYITGEMSCNILDNIDTTSCTKGINYDDHEKYLDIKTIYYIGEDLKIIKQ